MKNHLVLLFLLLSSIAIAQPANDDCLNAIFITNVNNWCSSDGQYSNSNATVSLPSPPSCFIGNNNDVWFSFTAVATNLNVSIVGNSAPFPGGTISSPEVAIFSGTCGSLTEIACRSDALGTNVVDQFATNLTIGDTYYILVDGRGNNTGDFRLCINSFNPVPEPSSDCATGVVLCDKSSFSIGNISGNGFDPNEIDGSPCSSSACGYGEYNSVWYKWTCDQSGGLTFTITPLNPSDDIDFWVYEIPSLNNCGNKIPLRCMTSGENVGSPLPDWVACTGATGLAGGDTDDHENCGCTAGDNNFLAPINMISGRSYALVIENFSGVGNGNANNGISITFGGTGTFLGPEADFDTDPPLTQGFPDTVCWNDIIFTDQSTNGVSPIVGWDWDFGTDASPGSAGTKGPHTVSYSTPGIKTIVLTVESQSGCLTTEVRNIYVDPCCGDGANGPWSLGANGTTTDVTCPFASDGSISTTINGSHAPFEIVWNTGEMTPNITGLGPGTYSYTLTDAYDCESLGDFVIISPVEPVIDIVVTMPTCDGGMDGGITVTVNGPAPPYLYNWDGTGFGTNNTLINLPVSTHTLTIEDNTGCQFDYIIDVKELELELDPNVQVIVHPSCYGSSDGSITIALSNGLPPYEYNWNNGQGWVTTNMLQNLPEGTYSVQARDANGCLGDFSPIILDDPDPLGITTTSMDVSCYGDTDGVINTVVTGGTPNYSYTWSNGATAPDLSNLPPGNYEVTVTDANGCVITAADFIDEPDPVFITGIDVIDNVCFGGTEGGLSVTATGGSRPFEYSVDGVNYQTDSIFTNLPAGTYTVIVRDVFGCEFTETATITEPYQILVDARWDTIIDLGYSVDIQAIINSSDPHTYSWTPSETLSCDDCFEPEAMPVVTTTYYVTVETYLGCIAVDSVTIIVNPVRPVYIPNAFTPNFDGVNDAFVVYGGPAVANVRKMEVYDRWGEHVFSASDIPHSQDQYGWDGRFKGQVMNPGVFVYLVEVEFLDGEIEQYSGSITLIK